MSEKEAEQTEIEVQTEEDKRLKVFVLSDHPLSPSGVGTQTRYMIEAMLNTGKYKFICFGGAIKHQDYTPQKTEQYGDDWIIYPVDGYGNQEMVRSLIQSERPDILWFMTDPRFWPWLWAIENEIRPNMPMVYYHVWDNVPYPSYNKPFYESNDLICTISKVTDDIVSNVAPQVERLHVPHAVNTDIFKRHPDDVVEAFKKDNIPGNQDATLFFWNNRNARRKQSGTLIWWFKEFLDEVGHDQARLLMHTDPSDPNGQDLNAILRELGIQNGEVLFSLEKIPPEHLSFMYNMCDCTINISDAEGFGLATLESLACEVPIIVNMTGGLQEQVTNGKDWFGVGLEPSSKAIIGSQDVPFIYEDRCSKKDFIDALKTIHNMNKEERGKLGKAGRKHVIKNYNFEDFCVRWDEILTHVHDTFGSWETRKQYKSYELVEL